MKNTQILIMFYSKSLRSVVKRLKLAAVASYLTCTFSSLASRAQEAHKDRPREAPKDEHPAAKDLVNRLDATVSCGDYAAAESLVRTLVSQEHALECAERLNRLATSHRHRGNHGAAEFLLHSAVAIHRLPRGVNGSSGSRSLNVHVKSLNQLADLYRTVGNYRSAESVLLQAVEIQRNSQDLREGKSPSDYVKTLSNLADLYRRKGDYASAKRLLRHAVDICRSTLGENHPDYATALNYLANLYRSMGEYASAEPLLLRAVAIHRLTLGENHPHHAASLTNLANLYRSTGKPASAEPLFRQAVEIHRIALGEWHPDYARSLARMAYICKTREDFEQALALYQQAAGIYRNSGTYTVDHVRCLLNQIVLLITVERASEALPLLDQWRGIENGCTSQCFSIASESQRTEYLHALKSNLFALLSLILQHLDRFPGAIRSAMDLVLQRKALASEALAIQRDALFGGNYPALEPRLRELTGLRMQIARKTLAGPGPEGLESHVRRLADWSAQKEQLEAKLARDVPEMSLERKLQAVDRVAIAQSLPDESVLVEFVLVLVYDFDPSTGEKERWKPPVYVALIIPAGQPDHVQMIDLGEAERIDRLIADFRAGIIGTARADAGRDMVRRRAEARSNSEGDRGSALRAALFDPLIRCLGGRTRLLLAPDGDLASLPFEALPTTGGKRLIDDYQISYLSCGRDVLRFGAKVTGEASEPLVVADPDFDLQDATTRTRPRSRTGFWSRQLGLFRRVRAQPSLDVAMLSSSLGGRRSRDLDRVRGAYRFDRLPGSRSEAEAIANLLAVRPWLGPEALEGVLKTKCCSPQILHLATHGFFLPDQPHDPVSGGSALVDEPSAGLGRLAGPLPENPMLRSGLALAGANTWLKSGNLPEAAEDGLLTAEDVTGLNLLATELVVLSACETGLGEVHVGEGVFGLRRAFVLAGAKTLVMSLWKVPDEQTRELMEDFYRRLLAGQGRAAALRASQLAMKIRYPDPYYWGAFICQGDPSPLATVRPAIAATGVAVDWPTGCGLAADWGEPGRV